MPFDVQGAIEEGYTPAEIAEHLATSKTSFDLAGARNEGYSDDEIIEHLNSIQQPKDTDFLGRVGQDWGRRKEDLSKAADAAVSGEWSKPSVYLQSAGNIIGGIGDVGGEALISGFRALPEDAQRAIKGAGNYVSDSAVGDVARQYAGNYQRFADRHPEAAANIGAVGNIATTVPVGKAVGMIGRATGDLARGAEGIANIYTKKYPAGKAPLDPVKVQTIPSAPLKMPLTRDTLRQSSQNAYRVMDESGSGLAPVWTDKVVDVIESSKEKPLYGGKVLTKEQKEINDALEEYSGARGMPTTMRDLQGLDSTLGDKAAQAYVSGNRNKGRIISNLQDKIRDMLKAENLSPDDLIGSREGIDALTQHAIPLWSTQAKLADIEKIIERGNVMTNPATSIKTGFTNLMVNKAKFNQYPKEVQKLIIKAANTGNADDLLMIVGSRLNPIIGGAVGGLPGAAISYGVSKTGRGIRTALKNRQANKVIEALTEPVRESVEKYHDYDFSVKPKPSVPSPVLALPAPERPMVGGRSKPARPATDEEWQNIIDQSNKSQEMGLTRDVMDAQQLKAISDYEAANPAGSFFNEVSDKPFRINQTGLNLGSVGKKKNPFYDYAKGGHVKKKNLTAEFLARASA